MLVQSSRETFYRMIQMILFYFFLFHFQDIIHSVFVHSFTFFVFPSQIPPSSNFFSPIFSTFFSVYIPLSAFSIPLLAFTFLSSLHFFASTSFPFSSSLKAVRRKSVATYFLPVSRVLLSVGYSGQIFIIRAYHVCIFKISLFFTY